MLRVAVEGETPQRRWEFLLAQPERVTYPGNLIQLGAGCLPDQWLTTEITVRESTYCISQVCVGGHR